MLVLALGYTGQQASTALGLLLKARIVSTFGLAHILMRTKYNQNQKLCKIMPTVGPKHAITWNLSDSPVKVSSTK